MFSTVRPKVRRALTDNPFGASQHRRRLAPGSEWKEPSKIDRSCACSGLILKTAAGLVEWEQSNSALVR
jgi:hypothetical protein